MPTVPATRRDTKSAIMDAAEILMARHGIEGVSLRGITAEAGANAAALHYHFGSRDELIRAILARGAPGLNVQRMNMLAELEAVRDEADVAGIVDLFVEPLASILRERGEAGRRFIQFIARLQSDRLDIHLELERTLYPDLWKRVRRLLLQVLPDIPDDELKRRVAIVVDTMLQSLANAEVMSDPWKGDRHNDALDAHVRTLKDFLAAGLNAPR